MDSGMKKESNLRIRPMQVDEKKAVHHMMVRSFPLVQRWFFSFTPHVLIAEQNGQLFGAVVLKLVPISKDHKDGLIYWVFTVPEARGMNIGQKLVEAGITFLEEQGCERILTCVEGYNTSSNKLFSTRDFSIRSPGEQFRHYGMWGTLALWVKIFHYIDIGHFVWSRPAAKKADSPALQWWGTIVATMLIAWLALWRKNDFGEVILMVLPAALTAVVIFFGLRYLAMRLTAHHYKLPVRYRAWESGFPLSLLIALAGGVLFPIPGTIYPASNNWRYRDLIPKLGPIALIGTLSVLAITYGLWALSHFTILSLNVKTWVDTYLFIGKPIVLFDTVMIFFPFVSFSGRRIWDWNRAIWVVLAVAAVVVFFL
jgi:GNAT superfamily N-acetyltransferase